MATAIKAALRGSARTCGLFLPGEVLAFSLMRAAAVEGADWGCGDFGFAWLWEMDWEGRFAMNGY
ncbi:MAG: hypothetical protein U5J83_02025 [Bryobacterales bacterium]|nr:hypothetical protein [Bryobacterales bacterium]